MKLSDLLVAISSNTNTNVTLVDSLDNEIITFNAKGYGAVESDLGERDVKKITLISAASVKIMIADETP